MARHTIVPDPFVKVLEALPGFHALTAGFTLCPECERCERSVVYLTPDERRSAEAAGMRLYGKGAATRINRHGCKCPFYLGADRGCGAYATRPLICHLFPIDIVEHEDRDGEYWWVLFGACAEVERGKLQGRVEEARALARQLDALMPDDLRRAFMDDAGAAVAEPGFYDHPVHYLLPLTPPA
ncbi:MAG: YkgJ family cysteine cluster protein [Gemmatimonadetes bacterium]|nr:YkgJ family cysteine cluster protein [Gemmatimonadota bacterium]